MHVLNDFYKDNFTKYQIFIVYITEAHAVDIWNIGESAGTINYSHKTIEDRIDCIKKLQNEYDLSIPIYADNMNNDFETMFASWPFRYFASFGQKLIKIGMPDDSSFDLCELFKFVSEY